jgi:hypothetical protein
LCYVSVETDYITYIQVSIFEHGTFPKIQDWIVCQEYGDKLCLVV